MDQITRVPDSKSDLDHAQMSQTSRRPGRPGGMADVVTGVPVELPFGFHSHRSYTQFLWLYCLLDSILTGAYDQRPRPCCLLSRSYCLLVHRAYHLLDSILTGLIAEHSIAHRAYHLLDSILTGLMAVCFSCASVSRQALA